MKKNVITLIVIAISVLALSYFLLNMPLNKPIKNTQEVENVKECKTATDEDVLYAAQDKNIKSKEIFLPRSLGI